MVSKVKIGDVELILSLPDEIPNMEWIGGETYMTQLLASWILVDQKRDIPMNPQILGKPGVGKTTLAYSSAKKLDLPVYIFQCTVDTRPDTRPEDLIISPVIGENNTIKYHASSLVTAMIEGGICILDEANRMSEKSWASLAPLLDQRRYIESIIAGIKVIAHPNFRICCTMNEDSSTFEVPEYIHSRLQPQIFIDFPGKDEEFKILEFNLPFAKKDLIAYTVNFLQDSHQHNKDFTARDGINICR
ncbi:MAG: AAA family ATPase, partial [Promethearchaeota archaeon]